MTHPTRRALRSSAVDAARPEVAPPPTRRELRDRERAAEVIALTASAARAAEPVTVVQGAAPLYTSRRAMRDAAKRVARDLTVSIAEQTYTAPIITVDAPSLGNGSDSVPGVRPARPFAPRVVRQLPMAPRSRPARSLRRIAQKITAGGALLFIGSLVVVTSLPAQAVQPTVGLDPEVAQIHDLQTLESVATETTSYFARDDITVND